MKSKLFIALSLLLMLGTACNSINLSPQSVEAKQAEYTAPPHAATAASVTLSASPESIILKPIASGSENYFEAQIDYIGTMTYDANGENDQYRVSLTENANSLNYSGDPLEWNVGIDPTIPLNLNARSSSGGLSIDLSEFTIAGLTLDTSSGSIDAMLPANDDSYNASLSTSSGNVTATVADGAEVDFDKFASSSGNLTLNANDGSVVSGSLESSSGAVTVNTTPGVEAIVDIAVSSGSVTLNLDAINNSEFRISSSSGAIVVDVPEGAAVRLEVQINSSGAVAVPGWLQQVSGDEKTGVWETAGYHEAESQIAVTITRNSSGSIEVR